MRGPDQANPFHETILQDTGNESGLMLHSRCVRISRDGSVPQPAAHTALLMSSMLEHAGPIRQAALSAESEAAARRSP